MSRAITTALKGPDISLKDTTRFNCSGNPQTLMLEEGNKGISTGTPQSIILELSLDGRSSAAARRYESVWHGLTKTGLRRRSSTLAKCFSPFKTDKLNSSWKAAGDSFRAINTARLLKLHAVIYGCLSGYVEGLTYIKELEHSKPFPNGF